MATDGATAARATGLLARLRNSDALFSLVTSPVTLISAIITVVLCVAAALSPWIAPHDPFDLASIDLLASRMPPAWAEEGLDGYLLGTDAQGRDMLSLILHGMRISLFAGLLSMAFASVVGIVLGLISGYAGGMIDAAIMRLADVQLSFPAILIALLIDGVTRGFLPAEVHDALALYIIVLSIGLANWAHFARTVRSATMVERRREYVQAARIIGVSPMRIMRKHILINII